MPDVLLYGDTERSAALRHEIPIAILDALLYAEVGGRAHIMTSNLEAERIAGIRPDAEIVNITDLGFHELLRSGASREEVFIELISRGAGKIGLRNAVVDFDFPLGAAERLRADGITLSVDEELISARRRAKSGAELAGIRRAQNAAEAGMKAGAELLRAAEPRDGTLYLDGEPLIAERVRATMRDVCWERGALLPSTVIVSSVWQGTGHVPGSGPLPAGLPIQIDLWPQDEASSCWADMTRTFVVGPPRSEEVSRQLRLVRDATERAREAVRPGSRAASCTRSAATSSKQRATGRSGRGQATIRQRAFSSRSATASGSKCTRRPRWASPATRRSCRGTSSRSSRACGIARRAESGSRTCCSSPTMGARR
jgi:Xaa-Pro aminopeptidase